MLGDEHRLDGLAGLDTAASGTIQVSGGSSTDLVDKSAAIKSVMNWVKLHPTNVAQKVQIIIEHFRENVGWRLDGKVEGQLVAHRRLPRRRDDHGLGRLVLLTGRGLTRRKGNPSLLGVESGFPAITEPPLDHEPLNRAARSGENLIEANHKVVTKAASTHANWWGYYRQKD